MMSIFLRELIGVWKLFQNWIVPSRLEKLERDRKHWVQPRACVTYIKIERRELVSQVQLRIVVERTADVIAQFLLDRPLEHIAHRVKIKMKIERDSVIEPDAFVVN